MKVSYMFKTMTNHNYIRIFKVLFLVTLINFLVENTLVDENSVLVVDEDYMDLDSKDLDVKVQQNQYTLSI